MRTQNKVGVSNNLANFSLLNLVFIDNATLSNRGSRQLLVLLAKKFNFSLVVNEKVFREYCKTRLFSTYANYFKNEDKISEMEEILVDFGMNNIRESVHGVPSQPVVVPGEAFSDWDIRNLLRSGGIGIVNTEDSDLESATSKFTELKKHKLSGKVLELRRDRYNIVPEADFINGFAYRFPKLFLPAYKKFLDAFIKREASFFLYKTERGIGPEAQDDLKILQKGSYRDVSAKFLARSLLDSKSISFPLYAPNAFLEWVGEGPLKVVELGLETSQLRRALWRERAQAYQDLDAIFKSFDLLFTDIFQNNQGLDKLVTFGERAVRKIVKELSKAALYAQIEYLERIKPGSSGYVKVRKHPRGGRTVREHWRKKASRKAKRLS